jgi:hypothetical protein
MRVVCDRPRATYIYVCNELTAAQTVSMWDSGDVTEGEMANTVSGIINFPAIDTMSQTHISWPEKLLCHRMTFLGPVVYLVSSTTLQPSLLQYGMGTYYLIGEVLCRSGYSHG